MANLKHAMLPWFDLVLGWIRADSSDIVLQLPLYHELIEVKAPGALEPRVAAAWGVDAEEAGINSLYRAIEIVAESEFGPMATIVCAPESEWQKHAYAKLMVQTKEFAKHHECGAIDLWSLGQPRVDFLLRLWEHMTNQPLAMIVAWLPDRPVYLAQAWSDDMILAEAIGSSPLDAIVEAVGRCCSVQQLQHDPLSSIWPAPSFVGLTASTVQVDLDGLQLASESLDSFGAEVEFRSSDWIELPGNLVVGAAFSKPETRQA